MMRSAKILCAAQDDFGLKLAQNLFAVKKRNSSRKEVERGQSPPEAILVGLLFSDQLLA